MSAIWLHVTHRWTSLQAASIEELSNIHEIGEVIAKASMIFCTRRQASERSSDSRKSASACRRRNDPRRSVAQRQNVVVTGKLTKYTRDQIHELIAAHGGHAASSVSSKTDYLVAAKKRQQVSQSTKAERQDPHRRRVREAPVGPFCRKRPATKCVPVPGRWPEIVLFHASVLPGRKELPGTTGRLSSRR